LYFRSFAVVYWIALFNLSST